MKYSGQNGVPRGSPIPSGFLAFFLFLVSCDFKEPAAFSFFPPGSNRIFALSKKAVPGILSGRSPRDLLPGLNPEKKNLYRYALDPPLAVYPNQSLELEYGFCRTGRKGEEISGVPEEGTLREFTSSGRAVFEAGGLSWILPLDAAFLGMNAQPRIFRYAVPMPFSGLDLETLSLRWEASEKAPGEALNVGLKLRSLASVERWYGFSTEQGAEGLVLWATPFVFVPPGFGAEDAALDRAPVSAPALAAEPPPSLAIEGRAGMWIESPGGILAVSAGPLRLDYSPPPAGNRLVRLYLPPGILSGQVPGGGRGDFPIDINAGEGISSLIIKVAAEPPFPEPLEADPGVVLSYAQESWRDRRFEIFRWAGFPRILIFDFADYATQGRFFTRLAFFVEKTGYRGRLLRNEELQGLHGWNAHDYRAEDLAAFFGAAKERGFPLNPEERELESLLLKENILRRNPGGDLVPGEGAIISLSRESGLGLRRLFMVHEGFHGLFFIDEEFREFSRLRWENLESGAKRFILSYFDYQKYDIKDNYLVVNEFMAHILQQPVSQSARYFGETLAGRIAASSWRHTVLPPKDEESGTWPALARVFRAEAEAFSAYVNRRWGLAAGRVESLSLR